MFPYVEERFSEDEVAVLQHYFTNVYGPVFALVNLCLLYTSRCV